MIVVYIFATILVATLLGLSGGLFLLWRRELVHKLARDLLSFAVGAMLGALSFDLIPESFNSGAPVETVGVRILVGILVFFAIERFFILNHCHTHGIEFSARHKINQRAAAELITLGDAIHNFLDGVVIATAFFVSIPVGIVTAVAQVAHELPQEISDFSIMLEAGMKRSRVLFFNLISGGASLLGGLLVIVLAHQSEIVTSILLPITAGGFLYITLSNLIPELQHETGVKKSLRHLSIILVGIFIMYGLGIVVHE